MSQSNEKFWVVWNPQARQPMVRHAFQHHATAEAMRLARTNQGQEFIVLSAVESFQVSNMVRTVYERDQVPF